jgi:ketosteroid isomerase-like protein
MRTLIGLLVTLLAACATVPPPAAETGRVNATVDAWHRAAAAADEAAYFGAMSPDFVFLGTDATERWELTPFRTFAHPYFAKGTAWTFTPRERHVMLAPGEDVAWFDEKLDSATYGDCRGTGVLRKIAGEWKIAHYNLTIPIPNDLAKAVVQQIRAAAPPLP